MRRNFVWASAGNALYSVCQWALISVLAKLTSPESVGKYALAVAITAPFMYLANFSIGTMLVTDTRRQFRFADYWTARAMLIVLSAVLTISTCVVSRLSAELFALTMLIGVCQFSDAMSELYRSVMLRREQVARIAVSLSIRGVLSVGAAAVVLYTTGKLLWAIAAMAVSRLMVLFCFDMTLGRDGSARGSTTVSNRARSLIARLRSPHSLADAIHMKSILTIARAAFPLTIVTVLTSLVINTPRYFIERYAGHRDLGIFAAMWSLLTAGNMVAIALGQVIFPRLSTLYSARDLDGFKRLTMYAIEAGLGLGMVSILGAIAFGRQILTLAYRPEYALHHLMFVAIMATGTLVYIITLLGNVATSARAFGNQAMVMGGVAAVTLVSSAFLVPQWGVWGAIGAVTLGCLTHIAGLSLIVLNLVRREKAAAPMVALSSNSIQ